MILLIEDQIKEIITSGTLGGFTLVDTVVLIDEGQKRTGFGFNFSNTRQMIFEHNTTKKLYAFTYLSSTESLEDCSWNNNFIIEVIRRKKEVPASSITIYTPA